VRGYELRGIIRPGAERAGTCAAEQLPAQQKRIMQAKTVSPHAIELVNEVASRQSQ
jgi:hypothetical protein